jgi:hypothetical protein
MVAAEETEALEAMVEMVETGEAAAKVEMAPRAQTAPVMVRPPKEDRAVTPAVVAGEVMVAQAGTVVKVATEAISISRFHRTSTAASMRLSAAAPVVVVVKADFQARVDLPVRQVMVVAVVEVLTVSTVGARGQLAVLEIPVTTVMAGIPDKPALPAPMVPITLTVAAMKAVSQTKIANVTASASKEFVPLHLRS